MIPWRWLLIALFVLSPFHFSAHAEDYEDYTEEEVYSPEEENIYSDEEVYTPDENSEVYSEDYGEY